MVSQSLSFQQPLALLKVNFYFSLKYRRQKTSLTVGKRSQFFQQINLLQKWDNLLYSILVNICLNCHNHLFKKLIPKFPLVSFHDICLKPTLASMASLMLTLRWIFASPRSICAMILSISVSSLQRSQKAEEYCLTYEENVFTQQNK